MLIIFDVDGTLIGGEAFDWKCFNNAFASASGIAIGPNDWMELEEVTARSFVHHVLSEHSPERIQQLETHIADTFLKNLQAASNQNQKPFQSTPGSLELLEFLNNHSQYQVAIATGDWLDSITFKLQSAGIAIKQFPHATSSDARRRADIIRLAAQRANRPLSESIYVGDGPWDLKACRELNIPFIGTGSRVEALVEAGAQWTLPTLHTEPFLEMISQIQLHKQIRQNRRDDQNFN
ncbi:MAG: HAD hydrolase-like protein [Opitutaceae bacterium]|jgi:phosphoglycolate phosphatase-like HAD superfamily hydrolase|nr:HAD hydrolase-like protein [Opitutaceae bacterium]